jgi:energy-coupling factor transporter ATP-binding protein EcfA2
MTEEDLWYRKVGFYANPFSIKPAPFDFKIFGQDKLLDELVYKIPAGTMSFIEGPLGSGKSTLMKHLIHKFKGQGQVIFFSCNRIDNDLNVEDLLAGKYGFWGKLFKNHPKNMIVLLDEAQELTPENTERIKYFFDQGNIKSVVFAGTDYESVKLHDSIKQRIGEDGILRVNTLSDEEMVSLVRNRIGDINLLSDDMIKKIFEYSENNPRRMLQNCDRACRHTMENAEQEFTEEQFGHVFNNKTEAPEVKKETPKVETTEPEVKTKETPEVKKEVEEEKPKKKNIKKKTTPNKKTPVKKKKEEKVEENDPEENLYEEEKE